MATFKDVLGREWQVRLTYGLITQIRELTGINILLRSTQDGIAEWQGNRLPMEPDKFVPALWRILEKQAEKGDVTRESFEDSFGEETYPAAVAAYYEAILSFSPTPALLKSIFGTGEKMIRLFHDTTENNGVTNSEGPPGLTPASSANGS